MKFQNASLSHPDSHLQRLTKLYNEITMLDEHEISVSDLLHQAADIISSHWIISDSINIKITHNGQEYLSESFRETQNVITAKSQNSDVILNLYQGKQGESSDIKKEIAQLLANKLSVKVSRILAQEELKENQDLLDRAYKLARIGTWEYDMVNEKLHWSDVTKEVHGFDPDYQPDIESTVMLFKEGYNRDTFAKAAQDAVEKEVPFNVELKIISGKGDERWIHATGQPEYENGVCTRFYGISQNVTDRRQAEEEVALNDRRFKALVQHGMDMIAILDEETNVTFVSPTSEKVLGFAPEHFMGKEAFEFAHEEDRERISRQLIALKPTQTTQLKPFRFIDSEDNWRWLEASITNLMEDPAVKGYVVNARDITERQLKQEEILDSLKEKQTLLAEIHHRIKNNLSVLTGLLQLQASKEHNEEVLERLFDSVARIQTMAGIHEQLYQSNNFANIEFADRLQLLIKNIKKSFLTQTDVELNFQCEPMELPFSMALPCSLIANEVITNIFKHAFKDKETGKVTIELANADINKNAARLTIIDNGIGLPEDFKPQESNSLGLSLINMLAEQLPAEYDFTSNKNGTTFNLYFKASQ